MRDLHKMMRSACNHCGSGIAWMHAEDLEAQRGVSPSAVREALSAGAAGGDAWWCPNCHAWGIFGGFQVA